MFETVIRKCCAIVGGTERLVDKARSLIGTGSLDEVEAYELSSEIERLMDILFLMDEATTLLRRQFERRPEIARAFAVHATLQ